MDSKPGVVVTAGARGHAGASALRTDLRRAVTRLDDVRAWPSDVGAYRIDMVAGRGIITTTDPPPAGRDTDLMSHPGKNLRIEVGVEVLSSSMASRLSAAGLSKKNILLLLLAHEIFHLGEVSRQAECKLPGTLVNSGFAKAARPQMQADWRALAKDVAQHYRDSYREAPNKFYKAFSNEAIKAHDAASETCADLMALNIISHVAQTDGQTLLAIRQGLIQARLAEQALPPPEYRCGWSLQAILAANPAPSLDQIVVETWRLAFSQISIAPDAGAALQARAAAIQPMLSAPIPDDYGRRSAGRRLLRKLGL